MSEIFCHSCMAVNSIGLYIHFMEWFGDFFFQYFTWGWIVPWHSWSTYDHVTALRYSPSVISPNEAFLLEWLKWLRTVASSFISEQGDEGHWLRERKLPPHFHVLQKPLCARVCVSNKLWNGTGTETPRDMWSSARRRALSFWPYIWTDSQIFIITPPSPASCDLIWPSSQCGKQSPPSNLTALFSAFVWIPLWLCGRNWCHVVDPIWDLWLSPTHVLSPQPPFNYLEPRDWWHVGGVVLHLWPLNIFHSHCQVGKRLVGSYFWRY